MFLAGNGDGTFQQPTVAYPTQVDAESLVAADVNGDGKLDLIGEAVINPPAPPAGGRYELAVWIGNGDGTFQPPQTLSINQPVSAGRVVVGNFFGDGHPDIAVADRSAGEIELFRNEGNGNYVFDKDIAMSGLGDLTAGDFNGNGISDLAVSYSTGATSSGSEATSNQISVFWNDGKGNFTQDNVGTYTYQLDISRLVSSHLNGTAQADLLVTYDCLPAANARSCVGFDAYYGQGNNKLYKRTLVNDSSGISTGGLGQVFGVDVNGDGIGDIVAVGAMNCTTSSCNTSPQGIFVWQGNADGSFQQTPQYVYTSTFGNVGPAVAADFTRNGMMDFAQPEISFPYLRLYLNATQRTACGDYTISPSLTVCQPVDNTYSPTQVRVQANSFDTTSVTAMQEYVDGALKYSAPVRNFDITFSAGLGPHLLVTKGWDASGRSFVADRTVTVYDGTPTPTCPASPDSASICVPSTASSASPVLIVANGSTGNSVPTAAQLYIDGNLVVNNAGSPCENGYCDGAATAVYTWQNLSGGNHLLVFKIWDMAGNVYTAQKTITVQ